MLDLWSYKTGLQKQVGEIAKELRSPGVKLAIHAAIGAGRHSVAKRLSKVMDVAVVELPPFNDLDAPLHGLIQLAGYAGRVDAVLDGSQGDPLKEIREAAHALASADRALIILMPVPPERLPREADTATRHRIERMLIELVNVPSLRLAVLATPDTRLRAGFTRTVEMEAPRIGAPQIRAEDLPEEFAAAANALRGWMEKTKWASTPLEARLQVGLIALGERPEAVGLRLQALARKMIQQLQQRWPTLKVAVHRLLLARRALPISEVSKISGVEPRWQPLLTACIGYGDVEIRVPELTRHMLLEALKADDSAIEDAHGALAQHHESLDGARSLRGLQQEQAINWMEKVHHLALGGGGCAVKWSEQEPAGREQLWTRARHLSRDHHQYVEAAGIYRSCIERFGNDPYSSHYLAYNLERARGELESIHQGYEYAAAEDPENPWWQQRWIRFLIAFGTIAAARNAWQQAIRSIDPDGRKMRNSPWLALNLHFWVARRWIAVGRLADAREVISEIPERWLEQEAELRGLVQVLATQEQALRLGESVYPASTPLASRWEIPRGLRPTRAGKSLRQWAPGRVIEASSAAVTVVVAPTPDEAQQLTFKAEEWSSLSGELAEDAAGFFELGTYEDGVEVLKFVPDDGEGPGMAFEDAELLARVRG